MAKNIADFRKKYKSKIEKELKEYKNKTVSPQYIPSREYNQFKQEFMPKHLSLYEKMAAFSGKVLNIRPDEKEVPKLKEAINTCHLNITPADAKSFGIFFPVLFIMIMGFLGYVVPLVLTGQGQIFFVMLTFLVGLILILPLSKLPYFLASSWRMKASNEMILAVFYIVTYMRHTSNLENALDFASKHVHPPLNLDLKKVLWNVETEEFSTIKESLDDYIQRWRGYNDEFIESMHLIESSLYEESEDRRKNTLDKALDVILDETYEKMLHYAHNLQGPMNMLHMFGIILPILGLVILPLVVSFMETVKWYHLFIIYNVLLPVSVYYLAKSILSKRPTGYGESDISEKNKNLKKYKYFLINIGDIELKIPPMIVGVMVFFVLFLIGFSPIIVHALNPNFDIVYNSETGLGFSEDNAAKYSFLGYMQDAAGNKVGPYGIGAGILSLFIPLSFAFGMGLYYRLRSDDLVGIREKAKKLEKEFASALFQMGNRLADGFPAEIAFSKVAVEMEGTVSGEFFGLVSRNISKLGMNIEQAIFDPDHGALSYYPVDIIESSMKLLVESSKKGPLIASQSLTNIARYIKNIHRVDERLKDLIADIVSSMQSQIAFLTPAIAGIVMGITSMISKILGSLSEQMRGLMAESGAEGVAGTGIMDMFGLGIPTFYFQFIVGLYVVEIVWLLTVVVNGIQNGSDELKERQMLGRNLIQSTMLYTIISLIVMIIFNVIAGSILVGVGT